MESHENDSPLQKYKQNHVFAFCNVAISGLFTFLHLQVTIPLTPI